MIRNVLVAGLLLAATQAQAAWECSVKPQDDVVISPQNVQVVGANGNLVISPQGDVQFNGQKITMNAASRQQAINYQNALRRDLPWIDNGATSRLEKGRLALDKIITEQVGESSRLHSRLATLNAQLKTQMNRIIEHRSDGLTFHHQAIDQVRADGQQLVNQAMGGILQDSINEMGTKAMTNGGGSGLQGLMGNLGGLQNAIQSEWNNQETDFQQFGKDVCNRVISLEKDRKTLVKSFN
ncbi:MULTISPECIES: DUF2884 domain-containing protein [Pantoea]|uniref:Uncharacterized DUF2884 family protein n=1 Tax=Pantoea stewartii subsp. stewartii DC283 TaxID=660596 RepID=H3RH66_PANSE|nr:MULTISPECIES: DUF2884 domain-containing protein [Pantoea]ARF48694.1 hypothetical protein DSJ_04585 [Pantoea stewartii subsp. stewartii DC283]EHT99406.1 uncharacterized DUF2884 family protein [Pantoea stewartii subsp. stewartii DC283]KAB0557333.1 DUF2884 domain-containing protein [Pantoea stewartii subsp. stewartii]KGD83886.1 hypothetical protein HA47_10590 [Pantoea stewartii subsp. indologenes]KHD99326.1 hypothetical protein NL54_21355 [Pantoea stewartii]